MPQELEGDMLSRQFSADMLEGGHCPVLLPRGGVLVSLFIYHVTSLELSIVSLIIDRFKIIVKKKLKCRTASKSRGEEKSLSRRIANFNI
jgi:hypothetical protein